MRGVGKHAETSTGLRSCTDTAPYTLIEQKGDVTVPYHTDGGRECP